jgi:hypothetical protein
VSPGPSLQPPKRSARSYIPVPMKAGGEGRGFSNLAGLAFKTGGATGGTQRTPRVHGFPMNECW